MYTKHVDYRFKVQGEGLAIRRFRHNGASCLEIEETRKNGQEDCHMSGCLTKDANGMWQWEEGRESFETYMGDDFADAIPEFLNANPPPEVDDE